MNNKFYIFLPLLLFLFLCNNHLLPADENLLLSKIYTNSEGRSKLRHEYIYDDSFILQKHVSYLSDTIDRIETYQYDKKGKIYRIDKILDVSGPPTHLYENSYCLIQYSPNGRMERSEYYLKVANKYELRSFMKFHYDSIGQIIKSSLYLPDSTIKFTTDYKYDDRGNITTADSIMFEYDNKNNPFYSFNLPEVTAYYSSRNNITKWVYPDSSIYTISYEYNEYGYPIKSIENVGEFIYEYIRK